MIRHLTEPGQLAEWRENILSERPAYAKTILVSSGTCGQASGSLPLIQALEEELEKRRLRETIGLEVTGCHGFCQLEPNIVISPENVFYKNLEPAHVPQIVEDTILNNKVIPSLVYVDPGTRAGINLQKDIPFYQKQMRLLTENNLRINPTRIEDYVALEGYQALAKVLFDLTSEEVIGEVSASGLRGRGGAGFSTGKKWEICRNVTSKTKYIICNADEGDPGAYMDRSLLEGNPHSIIEGMIIGAYAIGASEGFIYVRMEYPLAVKHVTHALEQAREAGLLGRSILGSEFHFDIHIVQGAGAFVSGEETSLMASIEGRRAFPRQRPPFPAQEGLWGKPTNINNVETWANVPLIINRGAEWYSKIGTEKSKGTKIFSLVGKINNTGLVEVPMGIKLKEIIYDIGGGIKNNKKFKAVQTGGPSGGCVPAQMLDLAIDYDNLAKAGSIMGSGGMIVMDEETCMVDMARYFLHFTQEESCGKCVPCRIGTRQMHDILARITEGRGEEADIAKLEALAMDVKLASLCGLGQTAPNPVLSMLRYFRDEYVEHVTNKRCPALVCKEIVSSPCQYACPIGQEASVYIALVAQGKFQEALDIIKKDNPLPVVCGRVCDHPCQGVCTAGKTDKPILIRAIKRFVLDWATAQGRTSTPQIIPRRLEKVAVIGAGPAGLTAGYRLSLKGYQVTIFEAEEVPGGMLATALPEHRLPKKLLRLDLDNILNSGICLRTKRALGRDFSLESLFRDGFKAVFLAIGAHKSIKMKIPGEEAHGVIQALELLKAVNLGRKVDLGKRVGVIGGGNAAIDAARVAIRKEQCKNVTIFYRRTRHEMPAYEEEVQSALEEGIQIRFLVAPAKVRTEKGRVKGLECLRMELGEVDESGRRTPIPIPGSEFVVELDTLIPAIGEKPDLSFLTEKDDLSVSKWGTIVVDSRTGATNKKGVFAGGDAVTGPSTVVEAMAAGKRAAESIERFIEGRDLEREARLVRPSIYVEPVVLGAEELAEAAQPEMPKLTLAKRKKNFLEVDLGLSQELAVKEARRCLRCELQTKDGQAAIRRSND